MLFLILIFLTPLLLSWPYSSLADPDLKVLFPFLHYYLVLGVPLVLVFMTFLNPQQDSFENIGVEALVDATTYPVA